MTQKKLTALLEKCGFRRVPAVVLAYLIEKQSNTAREIEKSCDLRQPEVSLAVGQLIDMKLVTATTVESEDKRGRPTLLYTLAPLEQVYERISKQQMAIVTDIGITLKELRAAMIPEKPAKDEHPQPVKEIQKVLT